MIAEFGKFIIYTIILWVVVATLGEIYDRILDWWDGYKAKYNKSKTK